MAIQWKSAINNLLSTTGKSRLPRSKRMTSLTHEGFVAFASTLPHINVYFCRHFFASSCTQNAEKNGNLPSSRYQQGTVEVSTYLLERGGPIPASSAMPWLPSHYLPKYIFSDYRITRPYSLLQPLTHSRYVYNAETEAHACPEEGTRQT